MLHYINILWTCWFGAAKAEVEVLIIFQSSEFEGLTNFRNCHRHLNPCGYLCFLIRYFALIGYETHLDVIL
ncbi:hypothetical protein JTE90_004526 [Oedothorax gibbosus]|uniref:Uncharacterized protein n=1 Tax=Oedothorax gibbosus TaxID=931172 RepID=A0AAV6VC14_9ARAC|nr:hypothetical protein JTE90_004526 [Oedothorax gibbosus]